MNRGFGRGFARKRRCLRALAASLLLLPLGCGRMAPAEPEPKRAPPRSQAAEAQREQVASRDVPAALPEAVVRSPAPESETPAFDCAGQDARRKYDWIAGEPGQALCARFEPPAGFARAVSESGSFASFVRLLPLKAEGAQVHLHDNSLKGRQDVHAAVVDIDVGSRDLQQCADAVMRLRAEYLHSAKRDRDICFFTASGERLAWKGGARSAFRRYVNRVFAFANTASLLRQMSKVNDESRPLIGDVFIVPAGRQGYGHAVMVVDAADDANGKRAVLLAQSYMPAQEIHVLKNPNDEALSPWYLPAREAELVTPEWTFPPGSLRRFGERGCAP